MRIESQPSTFWVRAAMVLSAIALLVSLGAGCSGIFGDESETTVDPNRGVGEECDSTADCRSGLVCQQRTCQPAGDRAEGLPCSLTGECAEGLYCSLAGVCASAGDADLGESCTDTSDCQSGFYCQYQGMFGSCQLAGSGDTGSECTTTADCMAGLGCGADNTCRPGLAGISIFTGGECSEPGIEAGDSFRVLFDVPRSGETAAEFYSLPFPNDIRMGANGLDLSGHFRPELNQLGDVVTTVIEVVEDDTRGFGPHQTVFFRFNAFPQPDSLVVGGEDPALFLVDIDPDSSEYGRRLSLSWSATDGRGKFICHNWLGVRPFWNQPFRPATTYAAIMTTAVRGPNGEVPAQSNDFTIVVGDQEPSDPALQAAWEAYAPLRDYLDAEEIARDDVAAAAVFTTAAVDSVFDGVRAAVEAAPVPTRDTLVACADGVESPCDDGLGADSVRGCFGESEDFWELHTRVEIPIYQEGTAPYLETGGSVLFNDSGAAIQQATDDICVAITVPKGQTMPEEGWPVVVFAHGTGGTFRGFVGSVAADLAAIGYVVIGYEGVVHGDRAGGSTAEPEVLFFNVGNFRAAYGNVLQGAADVLLMGRFAANLHVPAAQSPTGESIRANSDRVVFFGHSQGGLVAPPALATDDVYGAAILSGTGGGLLLSLLEKSTPIDVAGALRYVLYEGQLGAEPPALDEFHPVLNLVQMYYEGVDGLNYAPAVILNRPDGMAPIHVLQTYGLGDTATPPRTMQELAHAMGLWVMTPVLESYGRPEVAPPVSGNLSVDEQLVTGVQIQYEPEDSSRGHFVIFDLDEARDDMLEFLTTFAETGLPTIGE